MATSRNSSPGIRHEKVRSSAHIHLHIMQVDMRQAPVFRPICSAYWTKRLPGFPLSLFQQGVHRLDVTKQGCSDSWRRIGRQAQEYVSVQFDGPIMDMMSHLPSDGHAQDLLRLPLLREVQICTSIVRKCNCFTEPRKMRARKMFILRSKIAYPSEMGGEYF